MQSSQIAFLFKVNSFVSLQKQKRYDKNIYY